MVIDMKWVVIEGIKFRNEIEVICYCLEEKL